MADQGPLIITSKLPKIDIPEILMVEFAFETHKYFSSQQSKKPWIVHVPSGKSITFKEAKEKSRKVASALTKMGFKKGDILYFVTTECVDLYLLQLAVWMLGGAVRGTSAFETKESYVLQMSEVDATFICVDKDTDANVRSAASALGSRNLIYLSVGDAPVDGASHISELVNDDGSAFPKEVKVDVHNDILLVSSTSGSTGISKGVVHTNYTYVAGLMMMESLKMKDSILEFTANFGVLNICLSMYALRHGITVYHLNKFDETDFMHHLLTCKPSALMVSPYIGNWFARHPQLEEVRQGEFLKQFIIGGWVLDPTTSNLLSKNLPRTHIQQVYGMSEILFATMTQRPENGSIASVPELIKEGHVFTSTGSILANMEAKVLNLETRLIQSPFQEGLVLVRSPTIMRGYLTAGIGSNHADIDDEGWLSTGDIGFFDKSGNLYIKERANFMFRYLSHLVAPSEIESVLQQHPAVLAAGVVGMPNLETNNLARAFVVLRPGHTCAPKELCLFAEKKLPYYKHLHGGARIVDNLPANKGGKMDRKGLKEMALKDYK